MLKGGKIKMKKLVIVLLALSLIGNVALGIISGRLYCKLQDREQESANQTLFAMQGVLTINDILQNTIKNGFIENHEISSLQHQIIYTQAAFDRAKQLFADEVNNENYHIFTTYLTALEDVIYRIKSTKPLDKEIVSALTNSDFVAEGKYKYNLTEYIQITATKIEKSLVSLNIQEKPAADGEGVITEYPRLPKIGKAFVNLFE